MSGSIVGGVVGGVIGYFVGGPSGALYGYSLGSLGESLLFPGRLPTQYGPRLEDLKAQQSDYGAPIPIVYGTAALQGTVIWAEDIKEVQTEQSQGGKGGPSQTTVNYAYYGTFAVAICEGPIGGVLRIWAGPDKRLIYDGFALEGGSVRVYLGSEDQEPDPAIEAAKGVGNAPAYRGTAYVVLEDFPLANDGNRLPFLTFEVTTGSVGQGTCSATYTVSAHNSSFRLYDPPPVKLGNYGAGPLSSDRRYLSGGAHPVALDNSGNLYVLIADSVGFGSFYLKKVSYTAPVQEDVLYLGPGPWNMSMAYDPTQNALAIIQESRTNFWLVDCATFTATPSTLTHAKQDVIFSVHENRLRMLNFQSVTVGGVADADNYGLTYGVASVDRLIECGPHGIAVLMGNSVYLDGALLVAKHATVYDPVRDRLYALDGGIYDYNEGWFDFASRAVVTPATRGAGRIAPTYFPAMDRIIYSDTDGLVVMNPADFSASSFPDECKLFGDYLIYSVDDVYSPSEALALLPVPLPNVRNKIAVVNPGGSIADTQAPYGNDIFTFSIGAKGNGASLADVVADLSNRAGESRYDVSALAADTVDGYIIASQTDVRAAIDTLRTAYYFDAVESQAVIRFVKRGGAVVTAIDDNDLGAHEPGSQSSDPLNTVRKMESDLPRAVTVKYMLAATDYNQAAKQARRLIGSSGTETTVEVPLVLSDAKAQEVAEVNLHAAWAERLSYQFTLPPKYSYLEPTDLVTVKGHLMRLTKVTASPRGVLACEAIADEAAYYAPHVVVTETPESNKAVAKPGVTLLELF